MQESEYHYRAVCRGLYAQAYELKAFLAKIEHSKVSDKFSLDESIVLEFFQNTFH